MNNEEKILEMLGQIVERLDSVDGRLDSVDERLDSMDKRFDAVDERLDSMDKRFDGIDARLDELDERSLRTAVAVEGTVIPRLQLLYEGQENLRQTLAPKSRVEALEEEVATQTDVIKLMRLEITDLKKAQ